MFVSTLSTTFRSHGQRKQSTDKLCQESSCTAPELQSLPQSLGNTGNTVSSGGVVITTGPSPPLPLTPLYLPFWPLCCLHRCIPGPACALLQLGSHAQPLSTIFSRSHTDVFRARLSQHATTVAFSFLKGHINAPWRSTFLSPFVAAGGRLPIPGDPFLSTLVISPL